MKVIYSVGKEVFFILTIKFIQIEVSAQPSASLLPCCKIKGASGLFLSPIYDGKSNTE